MCALGFEINKIGFRHEIILKRNIILEAISKFGVLFIQVFSTIAPQCLPYTLLFDLPSRHHAVFYVNMLYC